MVLSIWTAVCTLYPTISVPRVLMDRESSKVIAKLENDLVRISFVACVRDNKKSIAPVFEVKTTSGWYKTPVNASAESYQILTADTSLEMGLYRLMHPKWKATKESQQKDGITPLIWNAGKNYEAIIKKAKQKDINRVELEFYPQETGILKAVWELSPDDKTAKV